MNLNDIPAPATDVDEGIVEDEEWLADQPRSRFHIRNKWVDDGYMGGHSKEVWEHDLGGEFLESKDGTAKDRHYPVFDVDHGHFHLRPSRSPGHYHLFYDAPMTWRQYKRVLKAMAKAGMIDKHWVNMTLSRKNGVVRAFWPSDWIERKYEEARIAWYERHGGGYY